MLAALTLALTLLTGQPAAAAAQGLPPADTAGGPEARQGRARRGPEHGGADQFVDLRRADQGGRER